MNVLKRHDMEIPQTASEGFQSVKNLVEFRRARRNKMQIVFSGGVYLGKHTLRPASVEYVCLWHTYYARSRMQAFSNGKPA